MKPAPDINAQCLPSCPAHGAPYARAHEPGCRWRPAGAFDPARERLDAAIERARAERATPGATNGHAGNGAKP